ncbi:hypothetical protein ES703_48228 [subsurface metagenome]
MILWSAMKNLIIALVVGMVLLLSSPIYSQITFERWYGGTEFDLGFSVIQTPDGGYTIAGCTNSFGSIGADIYIIRTDAFGDTLWTKTYGGTGNDRARDIIHTSEGGYAIVGYTESFGAGNEDVYLIEIDSIGDILWTKTYGGNNADIGYSLVESEQAGYVISGSTESFGAGYEDIYVIKTDSLGDTIWTKTYGGSAADWGYSLVRNQNAEYVIAATSRSYGGKAYFLNLNTNGDTNWTNAVCYFDAKSIDLTSDGGYIVAGDWQSFYAYIRLLKIDSFGDSIWAITDGVGNWRRGNSVIQTSDLGYLVAGRVQYIGDNHCDVYLLKTDSLGQTIWTKHFGGINDYEDDIGQCIAKTIDGGFVVAGYTDTYGAGYFDVYLIKTDSLGNTGIEESEDSVELGIGNLKLKISPNPFNSEVRIQISEVGKKSNIAPLSSDLSLHIYDSAGRLVNSIKLETNTYQLGADLVPGVYFLKLTIGEHKETQKLIKIR